MKNNMKKIRDMIDNQVLEIIENNKIIKGQTISNILNNACGVKLEGEALRLSIMRLRLNGAPIIASNRGYELIKEIQDVERGYEYIEMRKQEMKRELKALRGVERGLKNVK